MAGHSGGKRAGARRAAPRKKRLSPRVLLLALGITLSVVAWGFLVWMAIDFGIAARSGERAAWLLLGLCSLGAVAALFVGLMLLAVLSRTLGITAPPPPRSPAPPPGSADEASHDPGGRRAAR